MAGMLAFGTPSARNSVNKKKLALQGWDRSKKVIFCFVSQGIQQHVLKRSVEEALAIGTHFNMTFGIEVVVDSVIPVDPLFDHPAISVVHVPRDFTTPLDSRFKARSLYYAAAVRTQRCGSLVDTWIVHCDEDTIITPEAVAGIAGFLENPSSASMCGAGEIKYNIAPQGLSSIFNIVDYHRTGEDLGRYRLQFAGFRSALFGAHGSFVIIPAWIEEELQFDFGPKGSIAEDIYFFLHLRERGVPCVWVDGHVREQSPGDLPNFMRQRARWITGLLNVCCDRAFSIWNRLVLLVYLVMWRTTIVAGIALLFIATINSGSLLAISLWGLDMTIMGTVILVGTLRNIEEERTLNAREALRTMVGSFALTPVVCFLETLAVIFGVVAPRGEFFVVQKRPLPIEHLPALR
jgi:cellulose synthase/poly-beta-1,6-N-acetylglucosamine synthase-like glycosyltransferase